MIKEATAQGMHTTEGAGSVCARAGVRNMLGWLRLRRVYVVSQLHVIP